MWILFEKGGQYASRCVAATHCDKHVTMLAVLFWICVYYAITPVENLPIHIGQDRQSMKNLGFVAASDYAEWKRCLGFQCDLWRTKELKLIQCLTGKGKDCNKNDNLDTVEGDIFLTPLQIHNVYNTISRTSRQKRKVQTFNQMSSRWQLPIHYMFDESYQNNHTAKSYVLQALTHWQTHTCIWFKEIQDAHTIHGPYVVFTSGDYCGSFIGQIPVFPQPIRLSTSCQYVASIVHEIGHLIGFWHEHQRTDRDDYVTINSQHAHTDSQRKLSLQLKGETSILVPYDYGSLMQYWAWAFSKSGHQTITPKNKLYTQTMGQKVGLSFLDSKLANMAYCPKACEQTLPKPCQHGGYQDPLKCHQCRCPDGLGDTYCEGVAQSLNGDCSDFIILDEGQTTEITSPGYHDNTAYSNYVQCNWVVKTVRPDLRLVVRLDGSHFGVYCNKKVCFHWLEVKYHKDQSLTGPRFCCAGHPVMAIRSEGQQITLTLRANYPSPSNDRTGFKVTVTCERYCGQPPGEILSTEATFNCGSNNIPGESTQHQKQQSYPLCTRMDLAIAFDETWSSSVQFDKVIEFVTRFVSQFVIDPEHVQIGFVHFGSAAYIKYSLADLTTHTDVLRAVSALNSNSGKTNMAAAFKLLQSEFFTESRGSRQRVHNVCVVLVNSDAKKEQEHTVQAAQQLREVARIWAIGTAWANVKELEEITGSMERVVYQNSVKGLIGANMSRAVYSSMCDILVQDKGINKIKAQETTTPKTVIEDNLPQAIHDNLQVGPIATTQGQSKQELNPAQWSCDFETESGVCGISKAHLGSWILQDDRLPGSVLSAHSGHVFIYLTGTQTNSPSKLLLPLQGITGHLCLSFYIMLSGHHSSTLDVVVVDTSSHYTKSEWRLKGDFGQNWYLVEVDIELKSTQQTGFAGTLEDKMGQIGIDSVSISRNSCHKNS